MRGWFLGAMILSGCTFDSGGLANERVADTGAVDASSTGGSSSGANPSTSASASDDDRGLDGTSETTDAADSAQTGESSSGSDESSGDESTGDPPLPEPTGIPGYGSAEPVVELNVEGASDDDPTLRTDLLEIYFGSDREGSEDIYVSTRQAATDPWDPPELLAMINTEAKETTPEISPDGRTLSFAREVDGRTDVFVTTRANVNQPWDEPVRVDDLSSTADDSGFVLDGSGSQAFFCSARNGTEDLFASTRDGSSGPQEFVFAAPEQIVPLSGAASRDCTPWVERNAQFIVFASNVGKPANSEDDDLLWTQFPVGEFASVPMRGVNTGEREEDPWLADDLRVVYFARGIGSSQDIYRATRVDD